MEQQAILQEDFTLLNELILSGQVKSSTRIRSTKLTLYSTEASDLYILNYVSRYGTLNSLQFFLDHGFFEIKNYYDVICCFCIRFSFPDIYRDIDNNLQILRLLVQKGFRTNHYTLTILMQEFKFIHFSNESLIFETTYLLLIASDNIFESTLHNFYYDGDIDIENFDLCAVDYRIMEWPLLLYAYCFQCKNINTFLFLTQDIYV